MNNHDADLASKDRDHVSVVGRGSRTSATAEGLGEGGSVTSAEPPFDSFVDLDAWVEEPTPDLPRVASFREDVAGRVSACESRRRGLTRRNGRRVSARRLRFEALTRSESYWAGISVTTTPHATSGSDTTTGGNITTSGGRRQSPPPARNATRSEARGAGRFGPGLKSV
jgi:hypothetical protein